MSPGDLKRDGLSVEEYLSDYKNTEQEFYKSYYSDEL